MEQANADLEAKVAARTAELQKAEATYRKIYECAVEGIYQSSLDGHFLMANLALAYDIRENRLVWDDRMFQLYGVHPREFCGAYEAWQKGLHPEDRQRTEAELQVAIEEGKEFHTEFRIVWPRGEIRHIEAHAVTLRDATGKGIRMIGVNKDITEKKEAALKLLRQQIRLENMSQLGHVGAWEIDLRSQILYWSPMTKAIHDVPPDYEPNIDTGIGFYKPKYQEQIRLAIQEAIEFGVPWYVEAEMVTLIGREIWVASTGQPEMENGVCRRLFGSFQDISGRKSVENQLIKSKETAEKALAAKSNFLAMMSHEIRTPMNGVIGMLNLLQKTPLDDGQRSQVRIALSSAESLLTLINDILDFSKVEAGKLDLEEVEFDLIHYIGECVQSLSLKAQEKSLELVLDLRGIDYQHCRVKGDPGRLRQILNNLINNALKFTEKGEVLVKFDLIPHGERLLLRGTIQDTGIGIPAEKQEELFTSFSQVHSTRTYGGTGLGLAICKKLCELMGGTIVVCSEVGVGSQFTFTIFLQPAEQIPSLPRLTQSGDLSHLNILVVDDNATNREVLAGQLRVWGTKVVTTADAHSALAICDRQYQLQGKVTAPFDMAILDMKMPDIDGAQLSENLKADPRFREMPLLMMSSVGGHHEAQNFADLGFSAYLVKPVSPSDLFTALLMVHKGGQSLTQAGKILTQHYIQSFDFSLTAVPPLDRQWLKNVQILLVEDSPVNQAVAQGLLKELGLTKIDVALNGKEALVALRRSLSMGRPYTLVLMDCQMPEMDGYAASQAIREGEAGAENQNITIIAMTAYAMSGDRQRCLAAGMNDYVSKPIGLKALSQVLHQWLSPIFPDSDLTVNTPDMNAPDMNAPNINEENINEENINAPNINAPNINEENNNVANINEENINEKNIDSNNLNDPPPHTPDLDSSEDAQPSYLREFTIELKTLPIFDREGLLERVCDQIDLAQHFCQAFLDGIPVEIEKLHDALNLKDWFGIEQKSHSLRSSAGMIGAECLRKLATKIEELAKGQESNLEQLQSFVEHLDQEFAISRPG